MRVITLPHPPVIVGHAAVVGKKEREGPLGADFDLHDETDTFGMNTWERSESEMQRLAVNLALAKAGLGEAHPDAIFAGDLLNQCIGSAYGLESFHKPFFGLYGACSTFALSTMLASMAISAGYFKTCAAVSSSHFCSAEKQFRFPLEYGGQRAPTAQWTATAAGALILADQGDGPRITEVLPGRIVDGGIKDMSNMGAAMAPAAIDTLRAYFEETERRPSDFDLILTGDLGREGMSITTELMREMGIDLGDGYNDCGMMLYDSSKQDTHCGGSGCGCSACVVSGHVLRRFAAGELHDVLFAATGALMSPDSVKQGSSIPAIAHLVRIQSGNH
ncbi:MAG: stage V sporulation protein AD [Clostridia bacterium]|nr:stage V sporulation protein AD [Clostridia bacterium]